MKNEGSRGYLCAACALSSSIALAIGCGAQSLVFTGPDSGGPSSSGAGSVNYACDATNAQALEFLQTQCAQCHSGPRSVVFDFVLDVGSLTTRTSSVIDLTTMMPARYIVPGDPQHSLLYQRIVDGSQPPPPDISEVGRRPSPPTPSDFSLLHFWISSCLGASPISVADGGDSTGMGDSPAEGSACELTNVVPSMLRPSDVLWPNDDACQGDQLPMVGAWDGYVENIVFPSGSDAVHMVIRAANATRVCGSVVFGVLTAPPIADATKGYPPGAFPCASDDGGAPFVVRTVDRFDSFAMTMLDGRNSGARLQFRSTVDELWKPWCDLQRSYPLAGDPGGYSCMAPAGCAAAPVDCSARMACDPTMGNGSPCRCVSNGCTADPSNANNLAGQLTFDLRIVGDNADGSVDTGAMGVRNLHLTRAP